MTVLLARLLRRLGMLRFFNFAITQRRNNRTVIIPVIHGIGSENLLLSEQWMCDVLEKILAIKAGSFIDIGVNVGQTLIKLKLVKPEMPYVGFDPNPVCIFYAKSLIDRNAYTSTVLVPVGIADRVELATLNFYEDGNTDASASIVQDFRPQTVYRKEFVPCFDLAGVKAAIPQVPAAVVKIDVEGAELEVLQGISVVLAEQRPFVLIEILPVYTADNTIRLHRQQRIERMLRELNYRILRVTKSGDAFKGFQLVDEIGITHTVEDSDYLLCPAELYSRIK